MKQSFLLNASASYSGSGSLTTHSRTRIKKKSAHADDSQPYALALIKVIIGLGNPGRKYSGTRHNIGFRVVDELSDRYAGTWREQGEMMLSQISVPSQDSLLSLLLIKPLTFMNNVGRVIPVLSKKGIKPEQIVVVHDELEKKFGALSMRLGGSARGHNGLRSLISVMGKDFWRLRFGIGRPEEKDMVGDYVLAPFLEQERQEIPLLIGQAIDLLLR